MKRSPVVRSYDGPLLDEQALLAAAGGGCSSPEYVALFRWLTSRLKLLCPLEENLISGPGGSHLSTSRDTFSFLPLDFSIPL